MARRLGVIQTPSLTETAWAEAIFEQAAALGIGVVDVRDGTVAEHVDPRRDRIVLAMTQEMAEATLQPTDWLVIRDTSAMARWLMATATGEPIGSRQVATMSSHRLAIAETAAGTPTSTVIDAADLTAQVPVLGRFSREPTLWSGPVPDTDGGAVAMLDAAGTAHWPLSLFYFPDGDDLEGRTPDFDLTGRARLLMFGPCVHLPPGLWTIEVELEVDPQQREVPLRLEWGAGADYVEVNDSVRQAGVYTITLERRWLEIEAAQFRLWLTQARFQGHLRVVSCQVRRSADQSAAIEAGAAAGVVDPVAGRPIISA